MRIEIPVSFGELVDKLTILEIKKSKITNNEKLKNIQVEFELLNKKFPHFHVYLKLPKYFFS